MNARKFAAIVRNRQMTQAERQRGRDATQAESLFLICHCEKFSVPYPLSPLTRGLWDMHHAADHPKRGTP